ncbi:hypothetical protein IWQ56_001678 [Coemansia nantahalensis]|nr:hypothetical protein IWQ56_001678 [Coemansia nantahalensis]
MLRAHRERQRRLLPLFSRELLPLRVGFAQSLRDTFLIFTAVFWIGISFLYGAGYDTMRHIKGASFVFCNFDNSPAADVLSSMLIGAFAGHDMPRLTDYTGTAWCASTHAVDGAVWHGHAWGAVYVNRGFGESLANAVLAGAAYDPAAAVTLDIQESRHFLKASTVNHLAEAAVSGVEGPFAQQALSAVLARAGGDAAAAVSRANPRAIVLPFSYRVNNVAPYHFDTSLYVLSVALSMCMVAGSFMPSNMWKSIEEPFYRRLRVSQLVALRLAVTLGWAVLICLQAAGIMVIFHGPSWWPGARDYFAIFGIFLLNTAAVAFFIDCWQNWLHPRFLLAAYFVLVAFNIAGAVFGRELNDPFFNLLLAAPFHSSGMLLRTLLTNGSYQRLTYCLTMNFCLTGFWCALSAFLVARKARLVKAGVWTMANIPPPPPQKIQPDTQPDDAAAFAESEKSLGQRRGSSATHMSVSGVSLESGRPDSASIAGSSSSSTDIEIQDR